MQYDAIKTDNWSIRAPSKVDFLYGGNKSWSVQLDDELTFNLDRRSPIAGQLNLDVDRDHLIEQFTEGRFFVVDDEVIDYRLQADLKFLHKDEDIKQLVDHLGFAKPISGAFQPGNRNRHTRHGISRVIQARSQTEAFEASAIDSLGGQFDIYTGFKWSPFSLDIHSYIEMWRLVCENGAIANAPLVNARIPMMNQWKENLEISNQVIRHNFDKIVMPRLAALPNERISMADLFTLRGIVSNLASTEDKDFKTNSIKHLANISAQLENAWDPRADNLGRNNLKFIPAPVSAFDAMNIATEVTTHHVAKDRTNARGQAFVNDLIFSETRRRNMNVDVNNLVTDVNTFDNVDRAFFGITCH